MIRSTKTLALASVGLLLGMSGPPMRAVAGPAPTVEICHIPPGDPTNFHTIVVSDKALPAHLAHGDFTGACGTSCESLCDDHNACTIDACDASEQCVHSAADCNDGDTCTADSCDPTTGCVNDARDGAACVVSDADPCTEESGTCDATGACVPALVAGCCHTDSDCEAVDENRCTTENCIANTCQQVGTVDCSIDACSVSVCQPATGTCSAPEPIFCPPTGACEDASCDPLDGCVRTPIEGCCERDDQCDDGDECTTDFCLDSVCVNEGCAAGDECNVLVGCDPGCSPITEPVSCDDDDACTEDQCVDGEGCVSMPLPPSPTPEGNCSNGLDDDCDGLVDLADPDCNPLGCPASCGTDRTAALAVCTSNYDTCMANAGTALETAKCGESLTRCQQCAEQDYDECCGNPVIDPIVCLSLP